MSDLHVDNYTKRFCKSVSNCIMLKTAKGFFNDFIQIKRKEVSFSATLLADFSFFCVDATSPSFSKKGFEVFDRN